jgi:hypothetical protein
MLIWIADSAPVHSNTISKPSGAPNAESAAIAPSRAFLRISSASCAGEGWECECDFDEGNDDVGRVLLGIAQHASGWFAGATPPGGGRQNTSSAKPFRFANSRRAGLMSIATTRFAPWCFASAHARRPIAPTPKTRIFWFEADDDGDDEETVGGRRPTRREA